MIELDKIYNEDCLVGMQRIPDASVDAVICDLPYGTMKGIDEKHDWDVIIPTDKLFAEYERVLRRGGAIILFSQEPYTSHLRTFKSKNIDFLYPMIWKKEHAGNVMSANKAPISLFEDINVFRKSNPLHDYDCAHPLRPYFAKVLNYIGVKSYKQINERLGSRKAEHTFYVNPKKIILDKIGGKADHTFRKGSSQFSLCTSDTYRDLIDVFHIDKMEGFRTYESLKAEDDAFVIKKEHDNIFNLPEGAKSMSNVLEFAKDTDGFHPTQKPIALIRRLVLTYTNEGDTVLDNCMGSGTTAVACVREKRHFIGFEKDETYWKKAVQRVNNAQRQTELF